MKNIAIIPARGGSKRIPRKNIKNFLGKPIIAYSIEVALKSGLFDEVMVSTDDKEIAIIAQKYGANVPFMRSSETANDYASTEDVLKEVILSYKCKGKKFDTICCIYPCAVLIEVSFLKKSNEIFRNQKYDLLYPVVAYSHPIQRALRIDKNGGMSYAHPENQMTRTQDLEKYYHDSGQLYWMTNDYLYRNQNFKEKIGGVAVSEIDVQDIDNENDWKIAEMKYKLKFFNS